MPQESAKSLVPIEIPLYSSYWLPVYSSSPWTIPIR